MVEGPSAQVRDGNKHTVLLGDQGRSVSGEATVSGGKVDVVLVEKISGDIISGGQVSYCTLFLRTYFYLCNPPPWDRLGSVGNGKATTTASPVWWTASSFYRRRKKSLIGNPLQGRSTDGTALLNNHPAPGNFKAMKLWASVSFRTDRKLIQ